MDPQCYDKGSIRPHRVRPPTPQKKEKNTAVGWGFQWSPSKYGKASVFFIAKILCSSKCSIILPCVSEGLRKSDFLKCYSKWGLNSILDYFKSWQRKMFFYTLAEHKYDNSSETASFEECDADSVVSMR